MRRQEVARVLKLQSEPGAVVDDRKNPGLRWRHVALVAILAFLLGATVALLWARYEFRHTFREDQWRLGGER